MLGETTQKRLLFENLDISRFVHVFIKSENYISIILKLIYIPLRARLSIDTCAYSV